MNLVIILCTSWVGSAAADTAVLGGEGPLAGATLRIDERAVMRYYQDPYRLPDFPDTAVYDYVEEVNRVNLLVSKARFTAGVQVDQVALFANHYYLDDVRYQEHVLLGPDVQSFHDDVYLRLEKLYARVKGRVVEVQVGDGYASFGRGLALNLVRNTDIDLDTSLRGAKGVLRLGDWDLTVVSGLTNPQQIQLENPNLYIEQDMHHRVTGMRLERFGLGPLNIGFHGVAFGYADAMDAGPLFAVARYQDPLDAWVGGVTLEGFGLAGVDVNAELDLVEYTDDYGSGEHPDSGYGAYASAAAYPGRFIVLIEGKRYRDMEYLNYNTGNWDLVAPPTLEYERVITEDSSSAVNSNDIIGGRVRVDFLAKPGVLTPWASVAAFRDWDLVDHFNQAPELVLHPLAGLQWNAQKGHVLATTGLRNDLRDDDTGQDTLAHADVDIQVSVGGPATLELANSTKRFIWGDNLQQQADYVEIENALALHWGEHWSFVFFQDYSSNPLAGAGDGNLAPNVYGAGEIYFKPDASTTFKLFAGAYKEGIRCAGGQCRNLPGFKGLRLSAEGTFFRFSPKATFSPTFRWGKRA